MTTPETLTAAFVAGVEWWAARGTGLSEFSRAQARHDAEVHYATVQPGLFLALGTWPDDDPRRAFVDGVAWYEWHNAGYTLWRDDRAQAEAEAERCYPGGQPAGVG